MIRPMQRAMLSLLPVVTLLVIWSLTAMPALDRWQRYLERSGKLEQRRPQQPQ